MQIRGEARGDGDRIGRAQRLPRAVLGECWEAVKDIKKLPKDGRVAISKALMRVATFIKDTSTELSELGEGAQDEGGNPEDPDEDDLRFHDEDFTAEEMRVARACAEFASASFEFVRKIVAPIVRGSASDVDALERALDSSKSFRCASRTWARACTRRRTAAR